MAQVTTEPLIVTTRHPIHPLMRDTMVRTKFGRWLNDYSAHPGMWLVKQDEASNAFGPNVFRAVVDDFGTLVPVAQMAGYIANVAPEHRAAAMRREWVA